MQFVNCSFIFLTLLTIAGLANAGRRGKSSKCSDVKQKFLVDKPSVATTILTDPAHDDSLELCKFTNHSESRRLSCCTHDTETQLLLTAQSEYSDVLRTETTEVISQLQPAKNLHYHFSRLLDISKRMTEYELGSTLYLPHSVGRQSISNFYQTLENILINYDRSVSIFTATENLLDELFVYIVREATTPGSRVEPDPVYQACIKSKRGFLKPSPFPQKLENQATSLHYSAVAASYLSEAMDVTFQALNATRDLELSHHCLRDLMKLNHCQKCYGYTELRPCREFCEDVFMVCLNRIVRLDNNWEYHRKIVKILAEYILTRVDLQTLLNIFHTEFKANIDVAILEYSSYKDQLETLCGAPKMQTASSTRLKMWQKPSTTSYEGDFSGDLRKLVVNLELKALNFYASIHRSICSSEPPTGQTCWDGLTERVEKKKKILDFEDDFARYPEENLEISRIIDKIKRIRNEVLKIFLKQNSQSYEGSGGSGDDETNSPLVSTNSDDEDTTTYEQTPKIAEDKRNTVKGIVDPQVEDSIEIIEDRTTIKKIIKITTTEEPESLAVKNPDISPSSAETLRMSTISLSAVLVTCATLYL